jgi:hypothetical protein
MDEYIKNYDNKTFNKKIVYNFQLGHGGIGDCIKFFMYALQLCIKHNYRLYYLINNIQIEKYLKLKYEKMYITHEDITQDASDDVNDINTFTNITNNRYNIIGPQLFYSVFNYESININIQDVFNFSDEIINNSNILLQTDNYISLHLRMGDKYLETDKYFVLCKEDERTYNENKIFNFIEENRDKNIIFFCDNKNCKLMLKEKYNNIIVLNSEIGHTSLSNTTEKQTLDAITELYIMTNSEEIYSASNSGFSIIASKFKNIPLINIY